MVPTPNSRLRLLKQINGEFQTRKLTALLDAPSDGKATSSDVLAGRGGIGVITGNVLADGIQNGIVPQLESSYAESLTFTSPPQPITWL
jgi:Fe-S cluster assembly ATPase SufC